MAVTNQDYEPARRELLECFFADHPNVAAQERVLKALRFVAEVVDVEATPILRGKIMS